MAVERDGGDASLGELQEALLVGVVLCFEVLQLAPHLRGRQRDEQCHVAARCRLAEDDVRAER